MHQGGNYIPVVSKVKKKPPKQTVRWTKGELPLTVFLALLPAIVFWLMALFYRHLFQKTYTRIADIRNLSGIGTQVPFDFGRIFALHLALLPNVCYNITKGAAPKRNSTMRIETGRKLRNAECHARICIRQKIKLFNQHL